MNETENSRDDLNAARVHVAQPIRFEVGPQGFRHVAECLCCGHVMPLAVWREVQVWNPKGKTTGVLAETEFIGVCEPCRDAAAPLRGACSPERGCRCVPA